VLDCLREIILDVLLDLSDQVNLCSSSDREEIADTVLEKFSEEYLYEDADALEEELFKLKDENESLWMMLDELKKSDMSNYSEEMSSMIDKKLAELAFLIKAKPPNDYKN
jgi:hypothetical protein